MSFYSNKYVAAVPILLSLFGSAAAVPPPPPKPPLLRTAQMRVQVKLIEAKAGTVARITEVCDVTGTIPVYSGHPPSAHRAPIPGCAMTWKGNKLDVTVAGALGVSGDSEISASAGVSVTPPDAKPACNICGPQPLADSRADVKVSGAAKSVTFELAPNPVSILRSDPTVWFEARVTVSDSR